MANLHTKMPEMVRLDPDYAGFGGQVVGWADGAEDVPQDWPEYIRADLISEPALHVHANVVQAAIAEAVAKERERCADLVLNFGANPNKTPTSIAAAIRATPPAQQEGE